MKVLFHVVSDSALKNAVFVRCCIFDSGPWLLTRQILHTEGAQGLFRGLMPTFAREMPGYFVFFGGYEVSRMLLTPVGKTKDEIGT